MHNVNLISRFWLFCIIAVFSQQSLATDSPVTPVAENVTIGQLEAIQSRNFLLEQQVQTARLTRQLRESESESPVSQPVNPPAAMPFIPGAEQQAASGLVPRSVTGAVRLQEIYGRGEHLRARVVLSQGGVTEVSAGDQVPGSKLTVKSITLNAVKLSDGTELSF